jgi:pyridoxal 5'-phosphate synthase pdxT subunit
MRIGVLALQGDIPEHERAISAADSSVEVVRVRRPRDLQSIDALVMPGGESTTMAKHLATTHLDAEIPRLVAEDVPVLATCAGLILLARALEATPTKNPPTLGLLDVTVRRNDYGRQRESFEAPVEVEGMTGAPFPGVFIRAPRILSVGPDAAVFARRGGEVVGVRHGNTVGLAFHPELSPDPRLHRLFLELAHRRLQTRKSSRTTTSNSTPNNAAAQ